MNEITMTLVRETDNDLQELIAKLDDYLSTLYPAEGIFGLDLTDPKVKETLFVVAYHEGRPVGCGAVRPLDEEMVEIKRFCGHSIPEQRNSLSDSALSGRASEESGLSFFAPGNRRAAGGIRSFYKKLGYAQIEPFGEYIGSEYSLCFEKCLTS